MIIIIRYMTLLYDIPHTITMICLSPRLTDSYCPGCTGPAPPGFSPQWLPPWRPPLRYRPCVGPLGRLAWSSQWRISDLRHPWGVLRPRPPVDASHLAPDGYQEWGRSTISILLRLRRSTLLWVDKSFHGLIMHLLTPSHAVGMLGFNLPTMRLLPISVTGAPSSLVLPSTPSVLFSPPVVSLFPLSCRSNYDEFRDSQALPNFW